MHYRSQNCLKVLPFKTSNVASGTCHFCKKLKDHAKTDEGDVCNLCDEVVLGESDHKDLSKILQTIFPECSVKMQSFLMSKKMALERHPFGRRWSKDIIRLCLTLYCRSPRGYAELKKQ